MAVRSLACARGEGGRGRDAGGICVVYCGTAKSALPEVHVCGGPGERLRARARASLPFSDARAGARTMTR